MEKTRDSNTVWGWDKTGPVRVVSDEYRGDMGYAQISAQAHRKLTLTPVACGAQEHTDRRKGVDI